jgi:hypothetical protein
MADDPTTIQVAIIPSVVPAGPWRNELAKQYFALHLSAARYNKAAKVELTDLLPWKWGIAEGQHLVILACHKTDPKIVDVFSIEPSLAAATPHLKPELVEKIEDWIAKQAPQTLDLDWDLKEARQAGSRPRLAEQLVYLSTFPGDVPQHLDLIKYFRIKNFDGHTDGRDDKITSLEDIGQFVVAPVIVSANNTLKEDFLFDQPSPYWFYQPPTDGKVRAAVVKPTRITRSAGQPLNFSDAGAEAPGNLDFKTFWIKANLVRPYTDEVELRAEEVFAAFNRLSDGAPASSDIAETATLLPVERRVTDETLVEWARLRLKSVALNAQWPKPADLAAQPNASNLLIKELLDKAATELAQSQQQLPADLEKDLIGDLVSLHDQLATGDPAEVEKKWLKSLSDYLRVNQNPEDVFRALLADKEILDSILMIQWSEALMRIPRWPELATRQPIKNCFIRFTNDQLRLQRDVLLRDVFPATELSADKIVGKFNNAFASLFSLIDNLELPNFKTTDLSAIEPWRKYVERYLDKLKDSLAKKTSDKESEAKPGGFTFQLDNPVHEAAGSDDPSQDHDAWRKIAGIGLVLQGEDNVWRIASAANIHLTADEQLNSFDAPALVPVRVTYRNGVRYPTVTYNQRSLTAPNPLAPALGREFPLEGATDSGERIDQKYEYLGIFGNEFDSTNPGIGNAVRDRLKLTRLRFGKTYNAAIFMIDTAGGLPDELSAVTNNEHFPWQFDYAGWTVPANAVIPNLKVWRKVQVGQVRVKPSTGGWPEIPDSVSPLAKELAKDNLMLPAEGGLETVEQTPVVLLYADAAAQNTEIALNVRPPSVDVDVLERWLEKGNGAHLGSVLTEYYQRLVKRKDPAIGTAPLAPEGEDISVDDPAVDAMLVTVERYDFEAATQASEWKPVGSLTLTPDAPPKGIGAHQWLAGNVRFKLDSSSDDFSPPVDGLVTIPGKHAGVFRINVHALVRTELIGNGLPAKFADGFLKGRTPATGEVAGHICLDPFTFLIETPTAEMPAEVELWQQLKLNIVDSNAVEIRLVAKPESLDADARRRFRNVIKCDVLKQTWRWQGRPIDNQQDWLKETRVLREMEGALNDARDLIAWEIGAFAAMDDQFDTLAIPRAYSFGVRGDGVAIETDTEPIFVDKFHQDLRAYYVRYGIRAYSRYRGLFRELTFPKVSKHRLDAPTPFTLSGVGWRRAFLAYRGPRPKKPIIRAIVPLSKSYEDDKQGDLVAPLMVTLDETMFSFCGITETIECEIERANLPPGETFKCGADAKSSLFQIGPDPILSTGTYECQQPANTERPTLPCQEPLGHTFDTDARQPLFNSTSLIVRPTALFAPGNGTQALRAWDFAKVRFRRLGRADDADLSGGSDDEWTSPVWVQFIPSSTFGVFAWDKSNGPRHSMAADGTVRVEIDRGPSAPLAAANVFEYYMLFTNTVSDFRGKSDREQFLSCKKIALQVGGNAADPIAITFTPPQNPDLRCRLLEVQVHKPGAEVADDLMNDLFAPVGDELSDAKARITRVSPYFVLQT